MSSLTLDRIPTKTRFAELLETLEMMEHDGVLERYRVTYGNMQLIREHAEGKRISVLVGTYDDNGDRRA